MKTHLSRTKIKYEKKLADRGYNMMFNLQQYLSQITLEPNDNWLFVVGREIQKFIAWSDNHPHLAADICADICHSLSKMESDNFLNNLHASLRGRLFVHAFLGKLGESKKKTFDPDDKFMHYLAIRDFCSYLPQIVSFMKSTGSIDGTTTLFGLFYKTVIGTYKTRAEQRISKNIPREYYIETLAIIKIIRGDSFYDLLRYNAEIQVVKLVGNFRKAILNPSRFWNYLKLEFYKWWNPLKNSQGREKIFRSVSHVGIPALSAAASLMLFFTISIFSALILSLGILTLSYALFRVSQMFIENTFQTKSELKAYKQFCINELRKDPSQYRDFQSRIDSLIKNSHRTYALVQPQTIEITPTIKNWANEKTEEIEQIVFDLSDRLDDNRDRDMNQIFHRYNSLLNPIKLKEFIRKHHSHLFSSLKKGKSLAREYLTHKIIKRLESEWLKPKLTAIFLDLYSDHFATGTSDNNFTPTSGLQDRFEDKIHLLSKDSWNDLDIINIIKRFSVHDPKLRKGSVLSDSSIDVVDSLFPRAQ